MLILLYIIFFVVYRVFIAFLVGILWGIFGDLLLFSVFLAFTAVFYNLFF